jgi:alkyl hydroperoxide reductase subunit AhpC
MQDGTTLRDFDLAAELAGRYFLLVFFPMDFSQDAAEIRSLAAQLPEFTFNKTKVVAVGADSSFVTRSAFIPHHCRSFFPRILATQFSCGKLLSP